MSVSGRRTSGVRTAAPTIRSRARSISASAIKTRRSCRCRSRRRGRTRYSATARSSTARPSDSKTVISSSEVRPGASPASTSPSSALMCPSGDRAFCDGQEVVARLVLARLAAVDEECRARHRRAVELARVRETGSDRVHVRAGLEPLAERRTGSADDVTVQTTSASRSASSTESTATASGHSEASRSALSCAARGDLDLLELPCLEHRRDVRVRLVAGADDRQHARVLASERTRGDARRPRRSGSR